MSSLGDFVELTFHWSDRRQYNYDQIKGQLYEICPEEISDVIELAFAKVRSK